MKRVISNVKNSILCRVFECLEQKLRAFDGFSTFSIVLILSYLMKDNRTKPLAFPFPLMYNDDICLRR